ncbi:hypothetical protein Hanom_Chr00s000308g01634201 [Helianthus anomalus]
MCEDDLVNERFKAKDKKKALNKHHHVLVAKIKGRSREEILKEKPEKERFFVGCRIEKMHEKFEEAKYYGRYDKKRDCYINKNGDPVVHRKEVVFDDVLAVIPLSSEYYSNVKDKTYLKKLDKIIRDVMTASLKKMDEERMKNNVEELVDDLKKNVEKENEEAMLKS